MVEWTRTLTVVASLALCVSVCAHAGDIAFVSVRDGLPNLYLMDEDGSNIRRILDAPDGILAPAWSPDGETIAVGIGRSLSLFRLRDRRRTDLDLPGATNDLPSWSSDGKRIAFNAAFGGIVRGVYTADSDGGRAELLSPSQQTRTAWFPDGNRLIMSDRPVAGALASVIFAVEVPGGKRKRLTDVNNWNYAPALSPDGQTVAFAAKPALQDDTQIYVMDPEGRRERQLIETDGKVYVTGWTYPHQGILYYEWQGGNQDIWAVTGDGSQTRRLTRHPAQDLDAVMRPGPLAANPLRLKASVWGFMKRLTAYR